MNYKYSYYYYIPSNIKKVTITEQTEVPVAAFMNCSNITDISFEKELTSIGNYAFKGCTNLNSFNSTAPKTINLKGTFENIGSSAFYGCSQIENIVFTENVKHIFNYAFADMTSLKSVTVPSTVMYIDTGAFNGCISLEEITLPFVGYSTGVEGYQFVFGYIFGYSSQSGDYYRWEYTPSTSFVNATYGSVEGAIWQYTDTGTYYKYSYFYYIPTSLKKVTITEQTVVPAAAFNGCTMLEEIVFEKPVTETGNYAFQNCTAEVTKP